MKGELKSAVTCDAMNYNGANFRLVAAIQKATSIKEATPLDLYKQKSLE